MSAGISFAAATSLVAAVIYGGCGRSHDVRTEFYLAHGYSFPRGERMAIQEVADAAAEEVRRLLPALPRGLVLRAYAGADVIPETGETGSAIPPATVTWVVDPGRAGGVAQTVAKQLRATLFHEFHHLVRYRTVPRGRTLMDDVVSEGMATAFERDFAGAAPPWGAYPAEVDGWVEELRALAPDVARAPWMVRHPDGRRWVGLRAGTYLVDRAARRLGTTAAGLVDVDTPAVLSVAALP